jgi:hypothetical protein
MNNSKNETNLNGNVIFLSEELTQEFQLGQNLGFVIAFGINGEMKLAFRNGAKIDTKRFQNTNPLEFVDVRFNIPDEFKLGHTKECNRVPFSKPYSYLKFLGLCLDGGELTDCDGNPCP